MIFATQSTPFFGSLRTIFSNSVATIRFLKGKKKRDDKAAKAGVPPKEEEDEEQTYI